MKIAIAGYGVEGKVSYDYWRGLGHDVTIVDENPLSPYELPYGSASLTGKGSLKSLRDFDIVVRTPSLSPASVKTDGVVWSATNEFFEKCPAPIIGVTGTKGKGTTASLIAAILRSAGKTVHLVGNIGTPALSVLPEITPDDVVVFELSSFQLWDLKKSPTIAVVLMIETDHLDVHKNLADYVSAKANIRRHQTLDDSCLYHPTNQLSKQIALTSDWAKDDEEQQRWSDQAARYAVADDGQVYIKDEAFYIGDHRICSTEAVQLPGEHNLENACAAISAARFYTVDDEAIEAGLRSFTGLPHRLKKVRDVQGVAYYDDSIATTPGSAIAAIRSFSQPKVLILGGKDKGADYQPLIEACKTNDVLVLTIGALSKKLAGLCRKAGVAVEELGVIDMPTVVAEAARVASAGSVVVLSPAASSFDMFKSYSDRGEQFVQAVEAL